MSAGKRQFLTERLPDLCVVLFVLAVTIGTFSGGFWAMLGIAGAILMAGAVWYIDRKPPLPERNLTALVLVMLAVAALVNLQSWQPQESWHMWLQVASFGLPLLLFTNSQVQKYAASHALGNVIPYVALVGALALGIELVLQGPLLHLIRPAAGLYQYNRGLTYLVIFAFPILAMLWISQRRMLAVIFIIVLLLPASFTESRAAKLALILALMVTVAAALLPRFTLRAMIAVPFVAALWPLAARRLFLDRHDIIEKLPPSWRDRTEIWDYMSYRILDRPWLGWGLGGSRGLSPTEPHGALYKYTLGPAPHPHNAVLQLWVELGICGLALGVVFALLALHKAGRLKPELMPFAAGAWMAAFVISMIAYNLWSDSLWAVFALTGFAFNLLQRRINDVQSVS